MKIRQLVETEYGNRIDLSNGKLTILPSDLPDTVSDDFWCDNNQLTSLEHCPSQVGGNFSCSSDMLTSLEGCPSEVGGDFFLSQK